MDEATKELSTFASSIHAHALPYFTARRLAPLLRQKALESLAVSSQVEKDSSSLAGS